MLRPLLCTMVLACALPAMAAEWTLTDVLEIPGNSGYRIKPGDRSPPRANLNRLGFFSDLTYDARSGDWYALSDRGPGGGVIAYGTRVQRYRIAVDPATGEIGAPIVWRTIKFTDAQGQPFDGLNPSLLNGSPDLLGRSFDPEGLAVGRNGHLYVSDEYGPSLYEFDAQGRFLRAFSIPGNLRPRQADSTANYTDGRPTITSGRQDNRGFEGLTFNTSGTKLYGVLQDPLVNEGEQNDGRRSRWVRIVEWDAMSGQSTAQFVYPLESRDTLNAINATTDDDFSATNQGRSIGLSAITALSDHEFIVLERDNRGLGVEVTGVPLHKRLYRIDLDGASDVQAVSLAGSNDLPVGVVPVSKQPEADLLAALQAVGSAIPEKLEGVAIGPVLPGGRRVALVGSDNDYSVTQTGAGEQFDVCVNPATGERAQVAIDAACPDGMALIPAYLLAFSVQLSAPVTWSPRRSR